MEKTTRFGRAKFGGSPRTLLALVVTCGICFALLTGWIAAQTTDTERPFLVTALVAICVFPVASTGAWVVVVDRTTITGATRNPEQSIESSWYSGAATDSFHAALFAVGLLGFTSLFWQYALAISTVAIALGLFLMSVFCISYNVRRIKER